MLLAGGCTSAGRHDLRGDFGACEDGEDHLVTGPGEDCICLLVMDGPLALRDAEGQRIAPLLAMWPAEGGRGPIPVRRP